MTRADYFDGRMVTEDMMLEEGAHPIMEGKEIVGWRFKDGSSGHYTESQSLRAIVRGLGGGPESGILFTFKADYPTRYSKEPVVWER